MENKILTSKEFLEQSYIDITDTDIHGFHHDSNIEFLLREFAKIHVKAALKEVNKEFLNQYIKIDDKAFDKMGVIILDLKCQKRISKDILNAYSLTNIK